MAIHLLPFQAFMALVAGAKPFLDLTEVPPLVAASSAAMEMKAAPIDRTGSFPAIPTPVSRSIPIAPTRPP